MFAYCVSLDICLIFETCDQSSGVPTEVIKQKQERYKNYKRIMAMGKCQI